MADTTIEEKLRRLANLRAEIRQLQEEIAEAGSRALDAEAEPVGETIADDDLARLIVNRSHDLITVHNVDGTYLWISANCEEFLGIPREKLIGTSAYDLFHPEDLNRIAHDHADTLDISSSHVTYRLRQGDGSYRWAETRSYLNRTLDGTVRLVAITRDVHDRITEQERARHVERRLKERLMDLASTDGLTRLMNRMSGGRNAATRSFPRPAFRHTAVGSARRHRPLQVDKRPLRPLRWRRRARGNRADHA